MAILERDMKRTLIEQVERPSDPQITDAVRTINRFTASSLSVHMEYRFLEGFRVNEQSMKRLLKSVTGITPQSTQQLQSLVDNMQDVKRYKSVFQTVEDKEQFAFVKAALTSDRDSDGDLNISIAFAVIKFKKSVPWYGKLRSYITGGAGLADGKKFQDAVKVVCAAEMADFLKV